MNIDDLKAFVVAAETGSFSVAAEKIFLTQPAISKRIANLEAEMGTLLFDRIGRKVALTQAGDTLLQSSYTILNDIEDAYRRINNLSGNVRGPLRMATSHHIGLHRLPVALEHFHQSYPDIKLDLHFMDSEEACRTIEQGKLELAMVTLPRNPGALHWQKVWDDPLQLVVSQHHPLAKLRKVTADDLCSHGAILPGPGTYTREIILQALGPIRDKITIAMSTNYMEVLKTLTAVGLGWSALPHTLIDDQLKVVHIEGISIKRQLGIVMHGKRTLSNAGQAMINIIMDKQ